MRRTKYAVVLSDEQRVQLRTLVGRGAASARRLTPRAHPAESGPRGGRGGVE